MENMEALLQKSQSLVSQSRLDFKRYLYHQIKWNNRLIGIKGARGTGKTTILLQYLKALNLKATEAAYFTLDDLYFTTNSLVETAEAFYRGGGKYLFLDEVHKYPSWSRHIKNLYDFYPDLKIVFTGSSIIDIAKEEADLSRRALMYDLHGLSYREYLSLRGILEIGPFGIDELLEPERGWQKMFPGDFRPLQYFSDYLKHGYYPFFAEDMDSLPDRIQQLIRTIVEYDMAELHDFDIRNARKMLQLFYVLASNVPYKPNITELAKKSSVHRNTITNYLSFLEEARLIRQLYYSGISIVALQKPEKIYLNNTNLSYALTNIEPNEGNLRETFFASQVAARYNLNYTNTGDFMVNGKWTFEIGGKNKSLKQVNGVENGHRVIDDVAFPVTDALPLWVFGFLY
ncbi:ATP-binding protein [Pedobacter ginsengisoli]|uniref:ATP-binding protein n=1 Tax=Pedobacter ginsengisoli TaxID=363852 RepID=UPI00254AE84A|nr:ATP-binding protein [Pedobacter ginsengisoli]